MDLLEFKKQYVRQEIGISEDFGRIVSFIDFGNVNYWFEADRQDTQSNSLQGHEKNVIDLAKLKEFADFFSSNVRFYYGHDRQNSKSLGFIRVARNIYGKSRVFTKQIQNIRHYLKNDEHTSNTRSVYRDRVGAYVYIPKCNFDVEISVDAIKLIDHYDTVCLFSSDADFVHLARFLKSKGRMVILIKGGHIVHEWKAVTNLIVNAQNIKQHIVKIKQKPGGEPSSADRKPVSTGR